MKILVICLMLLSMVVISGCAPAGATLTTPSAISNPDPTPGARVVSSGGMSFTKLPDIVSQSGSIVEIKLTFTNHDSVARVIRDFPPEIKVESRNLPINNNIVRTFTAGVEQLELQPGESKEYVLTWDQKNDSGQQVPYGWYGIRVNIYSHGSTDNVTAQGLEAQATRILVLPPGGVMENNIELAQSQSADGITVNLEKLEMNTNGVALDIKLIPDNYKPEEELRWPTGNEAQYKVDDEDWKPAHKAEFGTFILEDGVRYIWDLDPVPQGSRKLTLRLTKLGGTEGFWEFEIPLESELPFEASMNTSEACYLPGEDIMYGIGIKNMSSDKITIDPFPPAMWIKPVDQDASVYSCEAGNRIHDIETEYPMSWYHPKGVWDQKDNNGQQVAPGWYEMGYEYVIIEQSTGKRYIANPTTRFQIVDPDSALNKDLEINQSVTAEGVTITLQSIEMNAVETKIYTFTTPPEYSLTTNHPPYQMESLMTNSTAEYSVDGGSVVKIRSGGGKADAEGITLT
jgi:flagellar hook assembly protein FlgD